MSTPLLTLTEIAARQEPPCHPVTVLRRARKDPQFPAPVKMGGRYYFDAAAYEAYERQREIAA